jgi:hypothetical protein
MANTNSPQFNTYKTVEVKFDGADFFRSGDLTTQRDLQIVNLFYDRVSQENKQREVRLVKRPGLTTTTYSLSKVSSSNTIRGKYYDVDQNAFYWAVGNKLYSVTPDVGVTVRTVATLNTSSGYVGFCSFLKADNTRYVLASDGTDLWVDDYAATSCTRVTDVDMPTPHQPYPLYLDGYVFLIGEESGDIYNSDNDDPTAWTAGEFIQAEISSDWAIRLFKVKNYIISMGYNSIEYFWDAGNATGSPLSRNDSPVRNVGYITGGCQIGDTVYFVGQDEKHNLSVYAVNSFKVERVSNAVVDRTIQTISSAANSKGRVNLDKDGECISVDGHTFYILVTPVTTWAYDVDEKFWYEWKGSTGTGLAVEAVWGMYNGSSYMAIAGQTYISVMSPSIYQDFGANFTCRYTTEENYFDSFNWKVCNRLGLMGSRHAYTGTSTANLTWSDNDWADGGTTARTVNVFGTSPYITRCGKFRARSFRIEYTDNYPWFATGLVLDINVQGI